MRALARPESLGGAAVTWDEFSWLVSHTTYDGGPGMDDPAIINPAVDELDRMNQTGVAFEGDGYSGIRGFLVQMRTRTATTDAVKVIHTDQGFTIVAAPQGAQFMRVYYSTDGWGAAKVVECTPLGRAGLVNCGLGYIPSGAYISYSAIVRYARGSEQTVRAPDGGNLFHKVP